MIDSLSHHDELVGWGLLLALGVLGIGIGALQAF